MNNKTIIILILTLILFAFSNETFANPYKQSSLPSIEVNMNAIYSLREDDEITKLEDALGLSKKDAIMKEVPGFEGTPRIYEKSLFDDHKTKRLRPLENALAKRDDNELERLRTITIRHKPSKKVLAKKTRKSILAAKDTTTKKKAEKIPPHKTPTPVIAKTPTPSSLSPTEFAIPKEDLKMPILPVEQKLDDLELLPIPHMPTLPKSFKIPSSLHTVQEIKPIEEEEVRIPSDKEFRDQIKESLFGFSKDAIKKPKDSDLLIPPLLTKSVESKTKRQKVKSDDITAAIDNILGDIGGANDKIARAPVIPDLLLPTTQSGKISETILFDSGSYLLNSEAYNILQSKIVPRLKENEDIKIDIKGFAGGDDMIKSRLLSLNRATEVRKYLIDLGIKTKRLHVAIGEIQTGIYADRVEINE